LDSHAAESSGNKKAATFFIYWIATP